MYFFTVNTFSRQKRTMHSRMRNPHESIVRRYAAYMIKLNEYLAAFPRGKVEDKIGVTELNDLLLNSMPNGWREKAYV